MNYPVTIMSGVQAPKADLDAIQQTILDYAECCYTGEHERREHSLHPDQVKVTVTPHPETKRDMVVPMSRSMAIEGIRAQQRRAEKLPKEQWRIELVIYDVCANVASAKVLVKDWLNYLHLAKLNSEWKIVNTLWQNYPATTMSGAQSPEADCEAIKQTILDYAECNYSGEYERRERALYPDLAKRTVAPNAESGRDMLVLMSRSMAVEIIRSRYIQAEKPPKDQWRLETVIYDVYANIASAKVLVKDWFDYFHLAKLNGEWKIVNVLWQKYNVG